MSLKNVFKRGKFQTIFGWAAGYVAAIVFNALLKGKFDARLWLALGAVLIVRVGVDIAFATKDARQTI